VTRSYYAHATIEEALNGSPLFGVLISRPRQSRNQVAAARNGGQQHERPARTANSVAFDNAVHGRNAKLRPDERRR
jgi:hypothetical protein